MDTELKVTWELKKFDDLAPGSVYDILQLRSEVFVVEQTCIYQDIDGKDQNCLHLTGKNVDGKLVAYARLIAPGVESEYAIIGRVCNSKVIRGNNVGKLLMLKAIEQCRIHFGTTPIKISAQQYLTKFYSDLGFVQTSEMYLEDDIPHIAMQRKYPGE